MRKIVEYPCVIGEEFDLNILPATLLGVEVMDAGPALLADVDDSGSTTERTFVFKKTGVEVPLSAQYVGSCNLVDPDPPHLMVSFHLFELV